jgi:hypothetical protein
MECCKIWLLQPYSLLDSFLVSSVLWLPAGCLASSEDNSTGSASSALLFYGSARFVSSIGCTGCKTSDNTVSQKHGLQGGMIGTGVMLPQGHIFM